jgi:hypothetical protein
VRINLAKENVFKKGINLKKEVEFISFLTSFGIFDVESKKDEF